MQAGLGDEAASRDRFAETQHDGLLGLRNGEQGAAADNHDKEKQDRDEDGKGFHLRAPPWKGAKAGRGTKGETPPRCSSRITLSAPPRTRSIVSR